MKVTTLFAVLALGATVEARVGSQSADEVNDFTGDRSLQMVASVSPSETSSPSSNMTSTMAPTMDDPSDMPLQAVCADEALRGWCVTRCAVASCCFPEDTCTVEADVQCLEWTACDVLYV